LGPSADELDGVSLAVNGSSLWVFQPGDEAVYRVDTDRQVKRFDISQYMFGIPRERNFHPQRFTAGAGWAALLVYEDTGSRSGQEWDVALVHAGADTPTIVEIRCPKVSYFHIFVADDEHLYVGDSDGSSLDVCVIDPFTGTVLDNYAVQLPYGHSQGNSSSDGDHNEPIAQTWEYLGARFDIWRLSPGGADLIHTADGYITWLRNGVVVYHEDRWSFYSARDTSSSWDRPSGPSHYDVGASMDFLVTAWRPRGVLDAPIDIALFTTSDGAVVAESLSTLLSPGLQIEGAFAWFDEMLWLVVEAQGGRELIAVNPGDLTAG
jgi:hypothetical protein